MEKNEEIPSSLSEEPRGPEESTRHSFINPAEEMRGPEESTHHSFIDPVEESEEKDLSNSELFEKVFADTSKNFRGNLSAPDGPRRYSAPAFQSSTLQRTLAPKQEASQRPHSMIMLNESHHIYDVPKLRPQKAPIVFRTGKPPLPPKEKRYSIT